MYKRQPLVYINEDVNVLRDDVFKNELSREDALSNAPAQNGVLFKVPKVIDL